MLKVLLVDDDINVLKCLRMLINWEKANCEVIGEVSNGQEAYELALQTSPDIIITDIKMPILDGKELCKKIRSTMCDVYMIFLSAYEDFSSAQTALEYNVNRYILKPITRDKLVEIEQILMQINANNKSKKIFYDLLRNSETESEIEARLMAYDFNYFVNLFDQLLNFTNDNVDLIKDVCFNLLNILFRYLGKMGIERNSPHIYTQLSGLKQCTEMIVFVKEIYCNVLQFDRENKNVYYQTLVDKMKEFVEANLSNGDLDLQMVAQAVNFSADYAGKIFVNYTGIPIGKYITRIRMEKAVSLLQKTQIPIKEITEELGYISPNYFTKVFKKIYKQTPSEFRSFSENAKRQVIIIDET